MKRSQIQNIVIDSLRSCTKWDTIDLEKDFREFISNETGISNKKAEQILRDFLNINPLERDNINFDFYNFLNNYQI